MTGGAPSKRTARDEVWRLASRYNPGVSLSVYIHFPYCLQKCPYCDFASASIQRADVPSSGYADAVLMELEERVAGFEKIPPLASVFFGGGTPSLWEPRELGRVLTGIRSAFDQPHAGAGHQQALEVTVECNPSSLDQARAAALREAGVNRLSIGVQSLNNDRLRFLGRLHDRASALRAVAEAQSEMPRVSADLMFGMPGQSAGDFVAELEQLLALEPAHLSIYALTIEPSTQFGALHRKGRLQLAPDGDFAETFMRTHEVLSTIGFEHYEVSNYARPGQASEHNLHYWRGGAYLGLGAGAVGCLHVTPPANSRKHACTREGRARRYRNTPDPATYGSAAVAPEREVFEEWLDSEELTREALMLGLRTCEGVDLAETETRLGRDPLVGRATSVEQQRAIGNLVTEGHRMRVPYSRWLHLDSIIASIF